jgi:hypothetical protein
MSSPNLDLVFPQMHQKKISKKLLFLLGKDFLKEISLNGIRV